MNSEPIVIGSVAVSDISANIEDSIELHPGLVEVRAKYSEDYKGVRFLIEGRAYKVSSETAERLIQKGMAVLGSFEVEKVEQEPTIKNSKTKNK